MMKILESTVDVRDKRIKQVKIPSIGLGTYKMIGKECQKRVADAIELGYRHIDTAQNYENEHEVGLGIKDSGVERKDMFLTDKVWHDKLKPEELKESVARSLDKLSTEYIDLLLIHWPNPEDEPVESSINAMHELKREGSILNIGVSNFTPKLMKKALSQADILVNQVEYHPFLAQEELLEFCHAFDVMLTAYSPLAQGKISDNAVLKEIGGKYDKTSAQVALRWLIQQHRVVAIPKASTPQHIKENIDVFDFSLSEEEMMTIAGLDEGKRLIDPDFAPNWGETP